MLFSAGRTLRGPFTTNMPRKYTLKVSPHRATLLNITPAKAAEIAKQSTALRSVRAAIRAAWIDATGLPSVSQKTLNRLVVFAIERDFHAVYVWLANAAAVCEADEISIIKYVCGIRRKIN